VKNDPRNIKERQKFFLILKKESKIRNLTSGQKYQRKNIKEEMKRTTQTPLLCISTK
jgi:hypothetical protein